MLFDVTELNLVFAMELINTTPLILARCRIGQAMFSFSFAGSQDKLWVAAEKVNKPIILEKLF